MTLSSNSSKMLMGIFLTTSTMWLQSDDVSQPKIARDNRIARQTASTTNLQKVSESTFSNIDETHPCFQFSRPNFLNMEFFSPGFPNEPTYRNRSDCVLVLEAPPGKLIRLDFRDYFAIEKSPGADCKNDYLEVRDGEYGFNKLIGKPFCGKDFPPVLESSDRHLWIHFKSDENIEYKGFRAVFEYIDRHSDRNQTPESLSCKIQVNYKEEGFIGNENISSDILNFARKHNAPIDCIWSITVREKWKIQLQFEQFELNQPNDCEKNFVQIFSHTTDLAHVEKKFCGMIAETVLSKGSKMFVRFYADSIVSKSTFVANFTAFRELDKNLAGRECDARSEYSCEDGTCISSTLRCNGRYNCRFRWDEDDCFNVGSTSLTEDHIVIIIAIFLLILSGMCFTLVFNCVQKLLRDHHKIQNYIRQSCEHQLNDVEKTDEHAEKKLTLHSNVTHSKASHRSSCHVAGVELLPVLIRGGENNVSAQYSDVFHTEIYSIEHQRPDEDNDGPEMCDSACQTRESLFSTQSYSSALSTPSNSVHANSPPAPFSTFGYKKNPKCRAEDDNTMGERKDGRTSCSFHTTKSAPDVIATH